MRFAILMATACLGLAACSNDAEAPAEDNVVVVDETAAPANGAEDAVITETSWEYTRGGKPMLLSVDASGNYVIQSGSEHVDHGTVVQKDGKSCFTTAMAENKGKDGCWTNANLEVGQSGETTSDAGETLTLTRVDYKPLSM